MSDKLVIDTNVAIVFFVGAYDVGVLTKHKRVWPVFDVDDYQDILRIFDSYKTLVIPPHVLAEASNLLSQIGEPICGRLRASFASNLQRITEYQVASLPCSQRVEYKWLGLTDCVLLSLAQSGAHLLTADAMLHVAATNAGYTSINLFHLKEQRLAG